MRDEQIIESTVVEGNSIVAAQTEEYAPIVARTPITIRAATMGDMLYIDGLQKKHSRELGFLPFAAIAGKIKLGEVLIAETRELPASLGRQPNEDGMAFNFRKKAYVASVGYLIAADRYQKRDEVGYVVQINVLPEYRRSLVAAHLLQAQFDRSAYGCRLYSCWCAQDLKANAFWEAMGFTAIAFRTGGKARGRKSGVGEQGPRVHIFWQKRIRAGDEATPFWYPSQTGSGQMREDRLVFPIPSGMHWSEVGPIVLDGDARGVESTIETKPKRKAKKSAPAPLVKLSPRQRGGMWFAHEGVTSPAGSGAKKKAPVAEVEKSNANAAGPKIDPRLKAMARELRDRWGERTALRASSPGKHDVKRLARTSTPQSLGVSEAVHRLEAA